MVSTQHLYEEQYGILLAQAQDMARRVRWLQADRDRIQPTERICRLADEIAALLPVIGAVGFHPLQDCPTPESVDYMPTLDAEPERLSQDERVWREMVAARAQAAPAVPYEQAEARRCAVCRRTPDDFEAAADGEWSKDGSLCPLHAEARR
jgi:hypothetical protein